MSFCNLGDTDLPFMCLTHYGWSEKEFLPYILGSHCCIFDYHISRVAVTTDAGLDWRIDLGDFHKSNYN
jgi:hypothetical protein